MTFEEFDQSQGHGWRAMSDQRNFVGAAELIEAYMDADPDLADWQQRVLHFHAAQMHAFAGAVEQALRHLPYTPNPDEPPDNSLRWNDYVKATEAFLRGDLAGLIAARESMVRAHAEDGGADANLPVVDRLIANFGKPYAEAY